MVNNNSKSQFRTAYFLFPVVLGAGSFFPNLFKSAVNRRLKKIPGFYGHIGQINFSVKNSLITVQNLFIQKTGTAGGHLISFSAASVELKLNRRALWKGELVTEVFISSPTLSIIKSSELLPTLQRPFKIDIPLEISQLKITNGVMEFIDGETKPEIKVRLDGIMIGGQQLTNIENRQERLGAKVNLIGNIDRGKLKAEIKTGFLEEMPAFDVNMEITDMDLKQLNNIFKAYGDFDINKGKLSLYTEVASRDGKFKGYVKPIIEDLEVLGSKDLHKGFFNLVWESVIAMGTTILENGNKEEIASKIPFEGNLRSIKVNTWYAISEVLLNAFVHALRPSIDFDINIHSIRTSASK